MDLVDFYVVDPSCEANLKPTEVVPTDGGQSTLRLPPCGLPLGSHLKICVGGLKYGGYSSFSIGG